MRILFLLAIATLTLVSCKKDVKQETVVEEVAAEPVKEFIGTQFEIKREKDLATIQEEYAALKPLDTNYVAFKAKVNSVCQKKGCWMRLALDNEKEIFVKFKDYGFFMPKDLAGKEVLVNGYAFVEETSVDDLKHFAEDAGKSEEEIAAITEAALEYKFIADGVLLEK